MNITKYFEQFSSDNVAGSANQLLTRFPEKRTITGRIAYKLADGGENYSLLYSNVIDSTYGDGTISKCNDSGEPWDIIELKAGLSDSRDKLPESMKTVTFDGKTEKTVGTGEIFCTDPIALNGRKGEYLHLEMTFAGKCFPSHCEIFINIETKNENGEFTFNTDMPVPLMIGCDRRIRKRVGFIGDSITQGIGAPRDSYKHWVAQIKDGIDADISVWDLGIGYARAYDAASDGFWLERAKRCDVVNVCFGVNDIIKGRGYDEVIGDLEAINALLKAAGCKTVVFTVPPFDFMDDKRVIWERTNGYIRNVLAKKADGFFDFAKYLCDDAPNENIAKYGGHPDEKGCTVVAEAYLKDVNLNDM